MGVILAYGTFFDNHTSQKGILNKDYSILMDSKQKHFLFHVILTWREKQNIWRRQPNPTLMIQTAVFTVRATGTVH